jgi:aspartate 4-decarboxylase
MQTGRLQELNELSPFELKDELITYAKDYSHHKSATHAFLNAGRGNPNWVATTPREAFFLFGQFCLEESKRVWDEPNLGGMPHAEGMADRLRKFLANAPASPGVEFLQRSLEYCVAELGFDEDVFVHELVDATVGDNYPVPDRMLVHIEKIVQRYLTKTMCDEQAPEGTFDVFAVEGGTAAMCYVFKSLMENKILHKGDTIAIGTPIFTPYIELPKLNDFDFKTVTIAQSKLRKDGSHAWQYEESELKKLEDPKIKAFFVVNPSNPASFAMDGETQARIVKLVKEKRPDLIILTDDVYGTFVDGFRSFAADLPRNTILVYSYSKHFGCTGWRLGVVAIHEDNVLDEKIRALPKRDQTALRKRYGSISLEPDKIKFVDRLVADSRDVALNHTAGLSTPQQVQMAFFSLFTLLDPGDSYTKRCREIVHERFKKLVEGLGVKIPEDPHRVGYYAELDLEVWGKAAVGKDFVEYIESHHDPVELVLALAQRSGTVLLNGSGFDGPPWSVRVSLANLDTEDYEAIGKNLRDIAETAVENWRKLGGK